MSPEPEEYELALRARAADREALSELVERLRLRLFALAYAELRHYDDAHDAVAAALLQICVHIDELREPGRMRSWTYSIVRNEVRRLRRGTEVVTGWTVELPDRVGPDPVLRMDIELSLRRLPEEQARAIRLFYLSGLSLDDIAARLGRPEGTVKSWLHRGRRRLAAEMEGYAPMTPASPSAAPAALLIHTELESALLQRLAEGLRAGGYELTTAGAEELVRLQTALMQNDTHFLDEWFARYELVVLDEWIGGRSAYEFLVTAMSYLRTRRGEGQRIGLCLLCEAPSELTRFAAWNASVDFLIDKREPTRVMELLTRFKAEQTQEIDHLVEVLTRSREDGTRAWNRLTERARRVIFFAQEEAARLGQLTVATEHLLLSLLREGDHAAAHILERLDASIDRVRTETLARARPGAGELGGDMQLSPATKSAILHAHVEADALNHNYLGTEHLLLGLINEPAGVAGKILREQGLSRQNVVDALRLLQTGRRKPPPEEQAASAAGSVPEVLPLIPIREPVYFPHNLFPLYCGRAVSLRALEAAAEAGNWIAVLPQRDRTVDAPGPEDLYEVGTAAKLVSTLDLPDGSVRAVLEGVARVRVLEYRQSAPFFEVRAETLPDTEGPSPETAALVQEVQSLFRQLADGGKVAPEAVTQVAVIEEAGRLADTVAPYLSAGLPALQELMETAGARARLEKVRDLLREQVASPAED